MILKFLLILLLCISFLWCAFSAVSLPFLSEGVWYLIGAVASVLLIYLLLRVSREKEDFPPEKDIHG